MRMETAHVRCSNPLKKFKTGDVVEAHVLGLHDAKSHKFLPISHANAAKSVLELTLKTGADHSPRTLAEIDVGDQCVGMWGASGCARARSTLLRRT